MELRKIEGQLEVEQREGDTPRIEGYSALFNTETIVYGMFREKLNPKAFERALSEKQDTKALFDHNSSFVLGRVGNGTLALRTDSKGLFASIALNPKVSYVADVIENIKRGDLFGQSFAFTIREARWTIDEQSDQLDLREIMEIKELYDVGPVTYPAYEQTDIKVRASAETAYKEIRDFAREFRNVNKVSVAEIWVSESHKGHASLEVRDGRAFLACDTSVLRGVDMPVIRKSDTGYLVRKMQAGLR